ncbi:hypothetical protein M5E87_26090 [Flavonifractor plautii]|nr:hypothetical protein M5E87_26090 [Flavonifractor plautii]
MQYVNQIAEPVTEASYVITSSRPPSRGPSGCSPCWTRRRSGPMRQGMPP